MNDWVEEDEQRDDSGNREASEVVVRARDSDVRCPWKKEHSQREKSSEGKMEKSTEVSKVALGDLLELNDGEGTLRRVAETAYSQHGQQLEGV